jgi:hypothetical protein
MFAVATGTTIFPRLGRRYRAVLSLSFFDGYASGAKNLEYLFSGALYQGILKGEVSLYH